MEIAKRDQLMQQYKDEIELQKKGLHVRYNHLKGIRNPILKGVKEEYKKLFERMDSDVNEHNRQLERILAYINGMLEEDVDNMELIQEKKKILRKQREFKKLKLSLNKMLR